MSGWWKELLRRASYLLRRSRFEQELDDEVRFHIESRAEELQKSEGISPGEALDRARREFGPRARAAEDSRSAWQFRWLEDFRHDLSFGARAFARNPGFTAIAIVSLGIGVGANCVMFSIIDGTLLRPPRIPHPNEVVAVVSTALDSNSTTVSYPDYAAVRDRSQSFRNLAAFTDASTGFAARAGALPWPKAGKAVTANFFDVLGSRPEMGRAFLPGEDQVPGKDLVTILSHQCWQDEFGGDAGVLGKQARIDGADFTIVGVMPTRFSDVDDGLMDDDSCFYVPLRAATRIGSAPDLMEDRGARSLTVFGRLKPGVPLARARAEVSAIAETLAKDYPATNRNRSMLAETIVQFRSGGGAGITTGSIAMTFSALVLLIACANVAGLLTSRGPARAKEIALRRAIGAGRPRLIRQLLTESMLLALGGAVAGVAMATIPIALAKRLVNSFDPSGQQPFPVVIDVRVLLFSIGLALTSVIFFGLMPAFRATRADLTSAMKSGGYQPPRRNLLARLFRGRNVLVAAQVAIALLVLTTTSVLYTGGYKGLVDSLRSPGFQVDHVLGLDFPPTNVHYKGARAGQYFKDLVERLQRTPGIRDAAVYYQDIAVIRPDSPLAKDDVKTAGVWTRGNLFDTLRIPIVQGRAFQPSDLEGPASVAIVNDVLAKQYWPGQNAIGKQIRLSAGRPSSGEWVNVIGVVKLRTFMAFGTGPIDTIFLPYGASPHHDTVLVRTAGDPLSAAGPIRSIIHDLDPDQAMPEAQAFRRFFDVVLKGAMLGLNTLGAMGVLALILALAGLYGLLAYEVSSRTREIGIRMALGARAGRVVRMALMQGVALAVCGVGAGVGLNWGLVTLLQAVFPSIGADPKPEAPNPGRQISLSAGSDTFGGEAFTILVIAVIIVTILAAWLPARRAARVDPNVALRAE